MKPLWTKKDLILATGASDPSSYFLENVNGIWGVSIDDRTIKKGDLFKNIYLANTLEEISKTKRKSFYEGRIAKIISSFIKDQGGFLSEADLANYHAEWVEPVSSNYRGYDVWELPPNGQGIAALQILNILENYDLKGMGLYSSEYIHLFTEVKKIVFATGNPNKLKEIKSAINSFEIIGLNDLGITEEIPETGTTLKENALQKAKYIFEKTGFSNNVF